MAHDVSVRALRNHTAFVAGELGRDLDVVASSFAELVAAARRAGTRTKVRDTWIAATARAHGVPVVAQTADFDALAVDVVRV